MKNAAATVTEDDFFVLSSLPPSPAQKRLALGFVLSLLVVFGLVAGPLSVDRQRAAPDRLAWSAHQRVARQVASCIFEAMHCRSHLGVNKRCARRGVHACELPGERIQTVQCVQIAEKLRRQTLSIDERLVAGGQEWSNCTIAVTRDSGAAFRLSRPVLSNIETIAPS